MLQPNLIVTWLKSFYFLSLLSQILLSGIKSIFPNPDGHFGTTGSCTLSHPFQVILPNLQNIFCSKNSTRNTLPSTFFNQPCNLSCSKSSINKLQLMSISTQSFSLFLISHLSGIYCPNAYPQQCLLKKECL